MSFQEQEAWALAARESAPTLMTKYLIDEFLMQLRACWSQLFFHGFQSEQ